MNRLKIRVTQKIRLIQREDMLNTVYPHDRPKTRIMYLHAVPIVLNTTVSCIEKG